jgi:hypothetical protein
MSTSTTANEIWIMITAIETDRQSEDWFMAFASGAGDD